MRDRILNRPVLPGLVVASCCLTAILVFSLPAQAFRFEYGDLEGAFDTTVSYGTSWRVEDRDEEIVGIANGGKATSVNIDDGNLNYDKGQVASVFRVTSELDLAFPNFGTFVRGTAFYDFENEEGDRERTPLSSRAKELVGSDAKLLDAYLWGSAELGPMPVQLRVGEQVVSWGESTFIQNSINTINAIDVSAVRRPGSELKEALLPDGMAWGSVGVTENLGVEAFYLYDWDSYDLDPVGSYFGTTDSLADGGTALTIGSGAVPEGTPPLTIGRAADRDPGDSGQYGVALRMVVPALNSTEFGFYFLNVHSRLPIFSATTTPLVVVGPATGGVPQPDPSLATYYAEYPSDMQVYGLSFSTLLDTGGIALQGEISYRQDAPLQIDTDEVIRKALTDPVLAALANPALFNTLQPVEDVQGVILRDVSQIQATATKAFGPMLGASSLTLIGEAGFTHVHDMPDSATVKLNVPGNPPSGIKPAATANSWGYQAAASLTYSNVIGVLNLTPRVSWLHDVNGYAPGPSSHFVEGRKAATLGLGFDSQGNWSADLSYTNFFGGGPHNLINDRDLVSANIKYLF